MHYKIIVIKPANMEIDDVMYHFQELDKSTNEIMNDNRGAFIKQISEADVPELMNRIYGEYETKREKGLTHIQYRATHTLEEFKEKFGVYAGYDSYIHACDVLQEYEAVKDLTLDDVQLIKFIKEHGFINDFNGFDYIYPYSYVKGVGFGYWTNPYGIWDYYTKLDKYFDDDFDGFLCVTDGRDCNYCWLDDLDIDATLNKFDTCYEYVIFCERSSDDFRLFTMDDFNFNEDTGLVDNTDDNLRWIYEEFTGADYDVTVLDIHR